MRNKTRTPQDRLFFDPSRKLVGGRAIIVTIFGLLLALSTPAQNTWNGSAGTTNWSTGGNWSFSTPPGSGDDVLFDNVVPGAAAAVVDNIVDADFTIAGLDYQTATTNNFHTTLINAGLSLNVNGAAALQGNPVFIGNGVDPLADFNLYYRIVGACTFTVTNTGASIFVV